MMSYRTRDGVSRMDDRDIDYAQLVHDLRVAAGVTQEQLARELGVTYGTVNGWENGKHRPHRLLARKLLRRAARAGVSANSASTRSGGQ